MNIATARISLVLALALTPRRFSSVKRAANIVTHAAYGMAGTTFIAALLHDPDFIIMDEPFFGLDPVNAGLLKDVMLDLKKQGRTILFSTHRMDQVEKLCDSICLINRGTSVLQGPLKQVKAQYGKSNVQIEYEGNSDFLQQQELVGSYNNYGNYVEVRLAPGADPQQLLHAAAQRSRISKFELVEPSLEEIFIEVVGKNDA